MSSSDLNQDQVCNVYEIINYNSCLLKQNHVFKLIKDIQFAMLTTTDEDGSLRSRPMAYKQGDSDSKTELWYV